jgi:hypothetical protein
MRSAILSAAALLAVATGASAQFDEPAYDAVMTFTDGGAGGSTTMTLAFDGTNFWSANGGYTNNPVHQYDADGNLQTTYDVPLDQRSIFTDGARLYIRPYGDPTIYMQDSPGNFSPYITLSGGSLDVQAAVVSTGSEYIANNFGSLNRWDSSGAFLGAVNLSGFGSQNNEAEYPQGRGIAFGGGYYLTYSNGVLSAWDGDGNRLDTTVLNGAGQGFDSHFSLSYTNDKFWVVDSSGGTWRGYQVLPRGNPCYPDLNQDGTLDLFDFLEFTNLFNAGDDVADCEADGAFDLFDFLCYTNAFNAGC